MYLSFEIFPPDKDDDKNDEEQASSTGCYDTKQPKLSDVQGQPYNINDKTKADNCKLYIIEPSNKAWLDGYSTKRKKRQRKDINRVVNNLNDDS